MLRNDISCSLFCIMYVSLFGYVTDGRRTDRVLTAMYACMQEPDYLFLGPLALHSMQVMFSSCQG